MIALFLKNTLLCFYSLRVCVFSAVLGLRRRVGFALVGARGGSLLWRASVSLPGLLLLQGTGPGAFGFSSCGV